ncbi:MAG: 3-hydroxyacyl-ACP dehydratase FabZ [Gammaproteobacteria bacterium]|nr:3-hydroxyacyl-ACP dehydratase FabZ [Gammaproteobacteria bacterium]
MQTLNSEQIKNHLPHRYPFLLVDRVIEYEVRDHLIAIKNVTVNEPFFLGHFPEKAIMPGVLIIESMAQAAALLGEVSMVEKPSDDALYFLVGVDNVRFKQPVVPGDQLLIDVRFEKVRRNIWKFRATSTVEGKTVCSAELLTTITDPDD